MAKAVSICVAFALTVGAAGSASSASPQPPLHRSCPPGNKRTPYLPAGFDAALAHAKRALYGERFNIQGQTYVTSPRNTELVAAMRVEDLSLVPGMQALFKQMQRRCGNHTPYAAWAFTFHRYFQIVPDFVPYFVVRSSRGWYVF